MTLKEKTHIYYLQLVQDRIDIFRDMISNLTQDAKNDAKGSAGDKHETALSMMHIEQEKISNKLREALAQKQVLERIDLSQKSDNIVLGSLVKANDTYLYLSTALPKAIIDNATIIALSPQSPLGSKLIGNRVGFSFEISQSKYSVESIE